MIHRGAPRARIERSQHHTNRAQRGQPHARQRVYPSLPTIRSCLRPVAGPPARDVPAGDVPSRSNHRHDQAHFDVMAYRRDMPATKRPTAQDAAAARQILLGGLAHDVDVVEILNRLVPLHPRNNTFPGKVFLRLAADVLDWAGVNRAHPVDLEGMRERFLPECTFDGRDRRKLQFVVLVAAAQHGGVDVDLLDEVAWWQTDDFWRYAVYAAVAYIRLAADRAGVPELEVCRGVAQKPLSWP
jgi:hypothetical protein